MSRNLTFAPGEYYHLYNRGTDKRVIFNDRTDYERFLSLMYLCNNSLPADVKLQGLTLYNVLNTKREDQLVDISVYCLMPNHFHFLVREKEENGISTFMQKLTTGYTMYFNKRNVRTGSLFQGTYKAKHASDDEYLTYLISYIHLNPIKIIDSRWKDNGIANRADAERFLDSYKYSSYPDYSHGGRPEELLITKNSLPEYFENKHDFKHRVTDWLDYSLQGLTL